MDREEDMSGSCSPIIALQKEKNSSSTPPPPTCLDYVTLTFLSRLYNQHHVDEKPIRIYKTAAAQFKALGRAMHESYGCPTNNELCWMTKAPFVRNFLETTGRAKKFYKPKKPVTWSRNPTEWLSNEDIQAVMTQYEEASQGKFKFVGVFPIDFASTRHGVTGPSCISPQMCQFDVKKHLAQGARQLGFVFNTDKHNQKGQHWISLFVGLDPADKRAFGVYYYDSVAKRPPPQVAKLMDAIARQIRQSTSKKLDVPMKHNTIRRQYKNTECGVYVMLFLLRMTLSRNTFDQVCETMGTDNMVQKYRDTLFRP